MNTNSSDFSSLTKYLEEAFDRFYANGSTYAALSTEMMKREKATGDISMETVCLVLLNPVAFGCLSKVLPLLHRPDMRAVMLDVLQETMDRMKAQEDNEKREE